MDNFLNSIAKEATIAMLKYVAGQFMFCAISEKVLDYKNTVVVTASRKGDKSSVLAFHESTVPQIFARLKDGKGKLVKYGINVKIESLNSTHSLQF